MLEFYIGFRRSGFRLHFEREHRHLFILRWPPMLPYDFVHELGDGRLKPNVSTLRADLRGRLLKAIEFRPPRLRVRDGVEF